MSQFETFRGLHKKGDPLLLGNAWNVHTAKLFESNGYKAIGTSSAAIANSLGYEDGEKIPFAELFFMVERILANVSIPVSVDLEAGFGRDAKTITANIKKLHDAGVAGINLEDTADRQLLPVDEFSKKLYSIKNELARSNANIFINLRTDAFLLNLPSAPAITLERIKAYENAGADGIFVPFALGQEDIQTITAATALPVNILCVPGLPRFDILAGWGVRRISLGSTAYRAVIAYFGKLIKNIMEEKSVSPLF
jgi:2-methylisocitrate lyase-like PEP mutase family enzyme